MDFFDIHVHSAFSQGKSSIEELVERAELLGYSGICFSEYYKNKKQMGELKNKILEMQENKDTSILLGFEARNEKELRKLVKMRQSFDILLARGGDLKMNRRVVETIEVDVLTHPGYERYDCGLNHVMSKLAKENDIAIEINFREILISDKKSRSIVLSNMRDIIRLAKKYKFKLILASGAISHWEMRSPLCMISMANILGLNLNESKKSLSKTPEDIINMAKKRSGDNWIMPGVEKE